MAVKNKGGRPKMYTHEIIKQHGIGLLEFMKVDENVWLKDYCIANDFPTEYLSRWEKDKENDEFCQSYKKAKDIQESRWVKMGLKKDCNTAFIIFTLRNIAKWKNADQEDTENELPDKITISIKNNGD